MDATAAAIDHVASESEADERSSTTFLPAHHPLLMVFIYEALCVVLVL